MLANLFAKPTHRRAGLTLIEILVALTMTLIVLGVMTYLFGWAGREMQSRRAVMEMANRSRSVEDMIRSDLASLTLDPRPYTDSTLPNGYFEFIEGVVTDATNTGTLGTAYLGDTDDTLAMTIRAKDGVLYRGTIGGAVQESPLAEVLWFTTVNDVDGAAGIGFSDSVRIHRRLLLIRPDLGQVRTDIAEAEVYAFLQQNDLSVRVVQGSSATQFNLVANDLIDLGRRENRFCHFYGDSFPSRFDINPINASTGVDARQKANRDDIMLTDVAAFDIQLYSPNAAVLVDAATNIALEPDDPGYVVGGAELGAFVDLGYDQVSGTNAWFALAPTLKSQLTALPYVYDTWTPAYESDGIDQDGDGTADQGTNGVNDVVTGGTDAPDDNAERETAPPYPYPVRGMQVTIRLVEKTTRQLHQTSIVHSFVPE